MREKERKLDGAVQKAMRGVNTGKAAPCQKRSAGSHQEVKSSTEVSLAHAPKAVGSLIRTARESLHLSQEQLAALISERPWQVSRAEIGAIERGRHLPGLITLIGLSQALHLDPAEVLERVKTASRVPLDLTGLTHEDLDRRSSDLFWAGDYRGALACYDAMLERLVLDPPARPLDRRRHEAEINLRRAASLRHLGAFNAARATVERIIAISASWQEIQANAYSVLATLHSQSGNQALAHDAADRAATLSKKCGAEIESRALCAKGRILYQMNRFEEARQVCISAREAALKSGDETQLAHIEGDIGLCLRALGRRRLARSWLNRAIELTRKQRLPLIEALFLVNLGWLALEEGNLEEASRLADSAIRIARAGEHWLTMFRGEWLRHKIASCQSPRSPDRNRLALLKKLLTRIGDLSGEREIDEFKAEVLGFPGRQGRAEL